MWIFKKMDSVVKKGAKSRQKLNIFNFGANNVVLDVEHAALLVPPSGQFVKEHELLDVTAGGYPAGQVGLQRR